MEIEYTSEPITTDDLNEMNGQCVWKKLSGGTRSGPFLVAFHNGDTLLVSLQNGTTGYPGDDDTFEKAQYYLKAGSLKQGE